MCQNRVLVSLIKNLQRIKYNLVSDKNFEVLDEQKRILHEAFKINYFSGVMIINYYV